jgi:hypothetical protein
VDGKKHGWSTRRLKGEAMRSGKHRTIKLAFIVAVAAATVLAVLAPAAVA